MNLSSTVAATTNCLFSVKRRAVSFTTAKASGKISINTTSKRELRSSWRASISWKKRSFASTSSVSSADVCNEVIWESISCKKAAMRDLNSAVLLRNSSSDKLASLAYSFFIFSTIGINALMSRSDFVPKIFVTDLLMNEIIIIFCAC